MLMHDGLHFVVVGTVDAINTVVNTYPQVRNIFSIVPVVPFELRDVNRLLTERYKHLRLDEDQPFIAPADHEAVAELHRLFGRRPAAQRRRADPVRSCRNQPAHLRLKGTGTVRCGGAEEERRGGRGRAPRSERKFETSQPQAAPIAQWPQTTAGRGGTGVSRFFVHITSTHLPHWQSSKVLGSPQFTVLDL